MKNDYWFCSALAKPPVIPTESEVRRICKRCGVEFVTPHRNKQRCDPCAKLRKAETVAKGQRRHTEKRAQAKRARSAAPS